MKYQNKIKILSLLLVGFLAFLPGSAMALTASGDKIQNNANVGYWVGGVDQGFLNASSIFTVDKKVDFSVAANVAAQTVTANSVATEGGGVNTLAFTITNSGNATQGFLLEAVSDATSSMVMTNVKIYIDVDGDFTWSSGDTEYTAATNAGDVAGDSGAGGGTMDVIIVADGPASETEADFDKMWLRVTVTQEASTTVEVDDETGGDNANAEDAVDVVLLDADSDATIDGNTRNAILAASGTYTFSGVTLTISKSSAVDSGGSGLGGTQFFLPGAIVEYTILVSHTAGSGSATSVQISDTIPLNTTGVDDAYTNGEVYRTFFDASVPSTVNTELDTGDPDLTNWSTTAGDTFEVVCGTMDVDDTCTITFQATIN